MKPKMVWNVREELCADLQQLQGKKRKFYHFQIGLTFFLYGSWKPPQSFWDILSTTFYFFKGKVILWRSFWGGSQVRAGTTTYPTLNVLELEKRRHDLTGAWSHITCFDSNLITSPGTGMRRAPACIQVSFISSHVPTPNERRRFSIRSAAAAGSRNSTADLPHLDVNLLGPWTRAHSGPGAGAGQWGADCNKA